MGDPILVTLLKMRPYHNQSSRENATPSSGTAHQPLKRKCTPREFSRKIKIHYSSTFIHIQTKFSNIQTNLNSIFNIQYSSSTFEPQFPLGFQNFVREKSKVSDTMNSGGDFLSRQENSPSYDYLYKIMQSILDISCMTSNRFLSMCQKLLQRNKVC